MAKFKDASGQTHEVQLTTGIYKEAHDAGVSVDAYINSKYDTGVGQPAAFDQMVSSLGISLRNDKKAGIRSTKIADILDGNTGGMSAANTSQGGGAPESRIIFPAAVLVAVEDKLQRDLSTAANAYDRFVANTDTIPGNSFTRVITNYDQPERARNRATAQLARPQNMLLLTASERPGFVPVVSLGIEWSDQIAQNTTIDFVALSIARHIGIQRDADAHQSTLALLNGDEDLGQAALPATFRTKANVLDTAITTAGKLTQKAWVKWLYAGDNFRRIDWIITDIDTAIAIENREGKPVIVGDDPNSPRIDSQMRVANPLIPSEVNVFVTRNPDWPAGTILGFQSSYAIQRVISLSANYSATEKDVIRRANAMRWDSGSIAYRMYDEAFSVLELAL